MKIKNFKIKGPVLFELPRFKDNRGYFEVPYNNKFILKSEKFVQDNIVFSKKNVLRGLHFQLNKPQGKLLKVLKGEIFDFIVDIRKNSKTFSKYIKIKLSDKKNQILWVPKGFAHGYLSLKKENIVQYKVNEYWYPKDERILNFFDKDLRIKMNLKKVIISEKDKVGMSLKKLNETFK